MARAWCVWATVTAGTVAAVAVSAPLLAPGAWTGPILFVDLLVRVSGTVLGGTAIWLWAITTVTVGQLLLGITPSPRGGARRLVLLACGATLAAGLAHPAAATDGQDALVGLRLPERAVAGSVPSVPPAQTPGSLRPVATAQSPARLHVVRPGESLWSIAAATSPAGADLDERWRSIWAANRAVVGDDPDLIVPGQRLRLPPGELQHPPLPAGRGIDADTHDSTDETGERP